MILIILITTLVISLALVTYLLITKSFKKKWSISKLYGVISTAVSVLPVIQLIGLAFGISGLVHSLIERKNEHQNGEKKEKIGLILAIISLVITIITIVMYVLFEIFDIYSFIALKETILNSLSIFGNRLVVECIIGYIVLIIYFVIDSIAYQIYHRKGYSKFTGSLWGLIPIYGIVHVCFAKPKRQLAPGYLKPILKPTAILMKVLLFAELIALSVIVILPIMYIVGSSLTKTESLPDRFWPAQVYFGNFADLFSKTKYVEWFKNTLIIAILNMIFGVIFITGAGYVFSRYSFKGKKFGLIAILVLQVFPSFMGLIAMFTLFETFGLLGRPVALTILYVGGSIPFNVWLIKGYLQQIPKDLDESANIDGANKIQIFFKIILPLSVPILSFVAVNQFMAPWMDYMLPSYLLNVARPENVGDAEAIKGQWTVAVGLFSLISGTNNQYTRFAAGALIIGLPVTVLYAVFQKFLIEGITAGATKG